MGAVAGGGLWLATVLVLLQNGGDPTRALSLLGEYLIGYRVSWGGAIVGLLGGLAGGYMFGYILACLINGLIGWQETLLNQRLEMAPTIDPLEAVTP